MYNNEILEKAYQNIVNKRKSEFETGFVDLDNVLSGVEKGALITIGARPAMGKTAFATSILEHLIKTDKRALFFTFEHSKMMFVTKLLTQIAELPVIKTRYGELSEKEIEILLNAKEFLANADLEVVAKFMTVDEIVKTIEESNAEYIFIDSLEEIKIDSKKHKVKEFENIVEKLKAVAVQKGIYIFLTLQLPRTLEKRKDKHPLLSDIGEPAALVNLSDVVMFLYRPEYYNAEEEYYRGKAEIIISKNDFGNRVSLSLKFRSKIPKFYTAETSFDIEF